ncbi:riboflavin synthase [Desulfopila inferna]|uniref:riboflavin synthase n=1 Tax=Desulfopila inferna TaxID=468528 RepID=UPI0019637A87|nr:riboflavin synthase [Desulfopila inferna]MBM9605460.1 riboflavin synthase [Desulfopila inferna]
MFTGIIEGTGRLLEKRSRGGGLVFRLQADFDLADPQEGESIAVNGSCLTAYDIEQRRFSVDISPESISRTTLGRLSVGRIVNMERALRLTDRLGGHIVSGHIDCTAEVVDVKKAGEFTLFTFALAERLSRYIIEKGSVAIDGISLTVNDCEQQRFSVSIIPHTLQITTLGQLKKGSVVNIEVDIIGKYVEKLMAAKSKGKEAAATDIGPGFLADHGFF